MVNKLKISQRVANDPEDVYLKTFADHFSSIYISKDHASYDNTFNQILKISLNLLIIMRKITAVTLFVQ